MKQVSFSAYGGPEVLRLGPAPPAPPGPTNVTIAVRVAGVNFADVMARMGLYPDAPKPPLVPGYEVAGVVEKISEEVHGLSVGDRVVALTRFGGYATHVTVPAPYVFRTPNGVTDEAAAALPVNYLTASLALYRFANVAAGESVLIHGAGGGVGVAAIQLARLRGARIIGTASPAKHDTLRSFGVDHVLDSRTIHGEALIKEVLRLTGGRGVDVVLDPVGGGSFKISYRLLAPLGRLVIYGVSAVAPGRRRQWWQAAKAVIQLPKFKPLSLINRNRGVFGLNLAHLWEERDQLAAEMHTLLEGLEAGRLKPVIAKRFPLERAAEAHEYLQSRANIGKVVLTT